MPAVLVTPVELNNVEASGDQTSISIAATALASAFLDPTFDSGDSDAQSPSRSTASPVDGLQNRDDAGHAYKGAAKTGIWLKGVVMRLWNWIVEMFRGKAPVGTAADLPADTIREWRNVRHDEEVKRRLNVGQVNPHDTP